MNTSNYGSIPTSEKSEDDNSLFYKLKLKIKTMFNRKYEPV